MSSTSTVEQEAERRAKLAGIPAAVVQPFIEAEITKHPFRVEYENLGYGRLVDIRYIGDQTTVLINLEHPMVQRFMWGKDVTEDQRSKLEIMLATICSPFERDPEKRLFWDTEMGRWGTTTWHAFEVLLEPGKDGLNMLGEDPLADEEDDDDDD